MVRAFAATCLLLVTGALASKAGRGLSMIQLNGGKKASVEINEDWLIVNSKHYSRKGAHDAWLGRIGRTSDLWVRPIMVNFRASAPEEWLSENVQVSTTLTLTTEQVEKIAFAVNFDVPGVGVGGGTGFDHNNTNEASYVLRGLTVEDSFTIKRWFNNHTESELVRDYMDLHDIMSKPRIVTTVWIMVKGDEESATECNGGHLTLRYGGVVGGTISGEGCTRSSWSFDPNTIIAYEASYLEMENMHTIPPSGRVKDIVVDWYWTR
eukprot:TRINITY_DN79288_c0_g1_i1.p1 TRINITY_DN79288_c0_g1~~TRINITY_DN79288_c0_g1_i1.p1  ORF type:complete len:287 (+),score=39.17 TRINITY_DN79288_c0_g1_i1:69-863(+)